MSSAGGVSAGVSAGVSMGVHGEYSSVAAVAALDKLSLKDGCFFANACLIAFASSSSSCASATSPC